MVTLSLKIVFIFTTLAVVYNSTNSDTYLYWLLAEIEFGMDRSICYPSLVDTLTPVYYCIQHIIVTAKY